MSEAEGIVTSSKSPLRLLVSSQIQTGSNVYRGCSWQPVTWTV